MDDLRRLEPIFHQPASIVALESFNDIAVHRPSETMITSLLHLFNHALGQSTPSNSLHQDPLFIVVLINRLISHSSSSSPSRARLSTTFLDLLPVFINLEFNCSFHPHLFQRIKKQLTLCMTQLAIRLLSSYHSNLDPLAEIINPLRHLAGLENAQIPSHHPHFDATSACLAVIKNVSSFYDRAKWVDSDSVGRKITKTHFETLYGIYNRLVATSLSVAHDPKTYPEYRKIVKSINLLLKIFKTMVKPLTALSASSPPILDWLPNSLLKHLQTYMDSELIQMKNHATINNNQDSISELNPFNPHICQYGDLLLQIQSCQSSIITPEVLKVYLKIVEHVSAQLVSINQATQDSSDTHDAKKLIKFYPLLNQALKLVNNFLNPWNDDSFKEIKANHQAHTELSTHLNREEMVRLTEILQPLLHFQFGLQSYMDGETQQPISDDSDQDSSDENTETSMEAQEEEEDVDDEADRTGMWEDQGIEGDGEKDDDEDQIVVDGSDDDPYTNIQPLSPSHVINEKIDGLSHPSFTYSILDTSNQNLRLVHKEPLQIEIEDLIENLKLIDQKNY